MKRNSRFHIAYLVVFTIIGLTLYALPGFAQATAEEKPARQVVMAV